MDDEQKSPEAAPVVESHPSTTKKPLYIGITLVVILLFGGGLFAIANHKKQNNQGQQRNQGNQSKNNQQPSSSYAPLDATSTDPVTKGQLLSNNMCTGSGSKTLTSAPLATSDIGVVVPMGNMIGGHVTPIDHEYYYQKDPAAKRDTYAVMAPADGSIVDLQHRTSFIGNAADAPAGSTDEYRIVISYSCTFFSYYDLVTSLDSSILSQLPSDFATTGRMGNKPIAVKAGQVIAHVGGQSLDFAVWDTTKTASGLLNPIAFSGEAWKIVTVPPLNYWSDSVKTAVLPFYVRTAEPRDGKFDYDVDGTAVGDWFLAGTNGYSGTTSSQPLPNYFAGHLALAPDAIDGKSFIFSLGKYNNGDATQFAMVGNTTDPATITQNSGVVKYTLATVSHILPNGQEWTGSTPSTGITVKVGAVKAVALIQMTGKQTMNVEVFPGKTADQISAFDSGVQIYNRGQDAVAASR